MQNPKKIIFLCTRNSCRSQVAEAIVNAHPELGWQAFSAGTRPSGYVHPLALRALAEIGIQHRGHLKSVEKFRAANFDLVVTVCDLSAEECPIWIGGGKRVHIGFPDPAKANGSEDEVLAVFRRVRDDIAGIILGLLS